MCLSILTLWVGKRNNGPITGSNVNTRVGKLQPISSDVEHQDANATFGDGQGIGRKMDATGDKSLGMTIERSDRTISVMGCVKIQV